MVSLSKELKVEDWYTPDGGMASYESVSPVALPSRKGNSSWLLRRDGGIALLDAASLGGVDHHTPLFETPPIAKAGEKHGWDGFATWQDKDGTAWVFVSISAAIALNDNVIKANSSNTHGGIVAFKVEETDGKFAFKPRLGFAGYDQSRSAANCERCVGRFSGGKLHHQCNSLRVQCSDRRKAILKRKSNSYLHRTFGRRRRR